jgi:hypothetical protein
MDAAAQQVFEAAFVIAWIGGAVFWEARLWIAQRTYHLQWGYDINYPNPLAPRWSEPFFHRSSRTFTRQSDPYLEALRQRVKKRMILLTAWIFLFPIPFLTVLALQPPLAPAR